MTGALTFIELLPLLVVFAILLALMAALWVVQKRGSARDDSVSVAASGASNSRQARGVAARRRRGGLAGLREEAEGRGGEDAATGNSRDRRREAKREARRLAREEREEALAQQREKIEADDRAARAREKAGVEAGEVESESKKALAAEVAEREAKEYEEWKGLIEIEEAGDEVEVVGDETALLARFVARVRDGRIMVVEDLAAEFGLRTEDAVRRLTELEENGTISGVFDDRGKFIYVGVEEMKAVADFIRRRGRVGIPELAKESGRLLKLDQVEAL